MWRQRAAPEGPHLAIDHVAQGHADLHPHPLDVVEIEVMEDGEGEGRQGDARGVHVGMVDLSRAAGAVALEKPDDLPEQHRLNDLDDFLKKKKNQKHSGMGAAYEHR